MAAAKAYVEHLVNGRAVTMITPENKTIESLTLIVRKMLKDENLIGKDDAAINTYAPRHLSETEKQMAKNYKIGDYLFIS